MTQKRHLTYVHRVASLDVKYGNRPPEAMPPDRSERELVRDMEVVAAHHIGVRLEARDLPPTQWTEKTPSIPLDVSSKEVRPTYREHTTKVPPEWALLA